MLLLVRLLLFQEHVKDTEQVTSYRERLELMEQKNTKLKLKVSELKEENHDNKEGRSNYLLKYQQVLRIQSMRCSWISTIVKFVTISCLNCHQNLVSMEKVLGLVMSLDELVGPDVVRSCVSC
jgi:hypothetical protein